jgi:hypothetical protein
MNALDKALLEFVRRTDGQVPRVIYIGWNMLAEVMKSDRCFQFDTKSKMYQGIPFFRVSGDDGHLAVF